MKAEAEGSRCRRQLGYGSDPRPPDRASSGTKWSWRSKAGPRLLLRAGCDPTSFFSTSACPVQMVFAWPRTSGRSLDLAMSARAHRRGGAVFHTRRSSQHTSGLVADATGMAVWNGIGRSRLEIARLTRIRAALGYSIYRYATRPVLRQGS